MKKSVISFIHSLTVLSVIFFSSCEIGMGVAVDLEAPELTIEKPAKNNAFVPRTFSIEGTATDNVGCEKVTFEYKYTSNGVEYSDTKECPVQDGRFSCSFTFDKDVEVSFEITAHDKNNNGSEKSSASRTFIIDSNDPKIGKVAVRRGNYIARLLPLADFTTEYTGKTALRGYPENKDYFQNQSFVLYCNLKDSYGIGGAKIELYEDSDLIIEKSMPADTENKFSPEFEFTESELIAAKPSLASGVHYLKPVLVARDTAGNIVSETKDYLAFESAYDIPHVKYNTMTGDEDNGGKITVGVQGSIPITVFDDDGIKTIGYKLVTAGSSSSQAPEDGFTDITVEDGLRDKSFDVTAPDIDGAYKLIVKVTDTTSRATAYLKAVDVKVTNGDAATIIIEDPHENSVPSLNNGKFTISGYTIDNQAVDKIAAAWLPAGNADIQKAEEFFDTYDFETDTRLSGTTSEKIWVKKISKTNSTSYDSNKTKDTFAVTYDFFEDFTDSSGKVINDAKVFMFVCKDKTDNITIKTFRLNKFTSKPSFKVEYKSEGDTGYTVSTDPLVMCKLKKTVFKISPVAENNMPIEACTVTASESTGYTVKKTFVKNTNEYVEFELSGNGSGGAPLSGQQFHLSLYAIDKLGNDTKNNLTIAFEEVGQLESIEADYTSGSILTAGETLKLQANFSQRVTVDTKSGSKIPYIQLSADSFKYKDDSDVDALDRRAVLSSGNESNTLYFEYTVPEGVEAKNLKIPVNNSITLNGAEVEGFFTKNGAGTAFNEKELSLDSIAPYIVSSTPEKDGVVNSTVTNNVRSVEIVLTFNEPVEIESGSLVLQRTDDWYIPPVISEDVFLKLFNSDKAIKNPDLRTALCGSTTNVRTDTSTDSLGNATMLPDGPYMQYTQGLDLSGTYAEPDTTTKYVLKYGLNIADTAADSTVSKIRAALEEMGYDKAEFDVQSLIQSSDKKQLTLKVTDADFIDCLKNGVEYSLTLTAESVRDAAYNYLAKTKTVDGKDYAIAPASGSAGPEYKFYIGPVATPVIRVNRKATNSATDKPTGLTDIMIDCETPGATISWGSISRRVEKGSTANGRSFNNDDAADVTVSDIVDNPDTDAAEGIVTNNLISGTSTGSVTISNKIGNGNGGCAYDSTMDSGDNHMNYALKIYLKATAEKDGLGSASGYEGAFKTMLNYTNPGKGNNKTGNITQFRVFGAQIPEGGSYTSGWPLTQNVNNDRKCYQVAWKKGDESYYWESWQILTGFCMQTEPYGRGGFQEPANAYCSFGQYIFSNNSWNW